VPPRSWVVFSCTMTEFAARNHRAIARFLAIDRPNLAM
jgi:hypothetical protein